MVSRVGRADKPSTSTFYAIDFESTSEVLNHPSRILKPNDYLEGMFNIIIFLLALANQFN